MRRVGIIGGVSWQSTIDYYRGLNELSEKAGDGFSTVDIIIYSLNFQMVEELQRKGDWKSMTKIIEEISIKLIGAGAELISIASNTLHKILPDIKGKIRVPFISIIDAVAETIKEKQIKKTALLGTRFTMKEGFYKEELSEKTETEIIIPDEKDMGIVDDIIFNELTKNIINQSSKKKISDIIDKMVKRGAEGVILGCTELPLLISEGETSAFVLNSTKIHINYIYNMLK